ncbi:MAG TPA: hypothetical protein VMV94_17755 [Phycisphaerae bacterium]|nr:hypothetical protein [Phycisphaerae bacterium]
MRIESGPTGERKVRTLLLLIMVAGFSAWFAYDGYIGYPAKNRAEHLQQLPTPEEREKAKDAPIYPSVTPEAMPKVVAALNKIVGNRATPVVEQALKDVLGGPPSWKNADGWYYFGPTFRIKIPLKDGRLSTPIGTPSQKTEATIYGQKFLALALAILSIYCLWLMLRVVRTHLVLDEGGLSYQGRGPIRWDDMQALDISRFSKKGWVDLTYDDNGTERKLRLDEYHLARFDEVIDELCARKGFENPLPVEDSKEQPLAR